MLRKVVVEIQPNIGRDHEIRLATSDEREPIFAREPELGPTCHYCSQGVEYVGKYVRRGAAVSPKSGKRTDYEKRVEVRLCASHAAEWAQVHHLVLNPMVVPVEPTLPRQQCPYCGAFSGDSLELIQRLGTGIHTLDWKCNECSRSFQIRISIGLSFEYLTIPEQSLRS